MLRELTIEEDYIGHYNPKEIEILLLDDTGYNNDKRIENAIANKWWKFIISFDKNRAVKSKMTYLSI